MASNGPESDTAKVVEPLRETEDIAMLLYKRAKGQEKQLAETVKREKETRGKLGKERTRFQNANAKISSLLPKKADIEQRILHKEGKIRQANERILMLERFVDNCGVYLAKGNVYEEKLRETQEKINEVREFLGPKCVSIYELYMNYNKQQMPMYGLGTLDVTVCPLMSGNESKVRSLVLYA